MKHEKTLLSLFLLLLLPLPVFAQIVNVPLNHDIYPYLDRLHTRQVIAYLPDTRPYARMDVARFLRQLEDSTVFAALTAIEKTKLERFRAEFDEELVRVGATVPARPAWHLYRGKNGLMVTTVDYVFRQTAAFFQGDTYDPALQVYQTASGGTMWGYIGDRMGVYFYGTDTKEKSSHIYTERQSLTGEPQSFITIVDSQTLYYDKAKGYISFQFPWLALQFGEDQVSWGPGKGGQLELSRDLIEFDQLRLTARLGDRIRFTSIQGKLFEPFLDTAKASVYGFRSRDKRIYRDRWLAAHRLEIEPFKHVTFGFHEACIYADRGLEWVYLNPLMFYWSAQHYLNDQDNMTLGADVSIKRIKHVNLYADFLIDDWKSNKLGTDWWGNKWGATVGAQVVDPPYVPDCDLTIEYTRIEPWVYTHFNPVNKFTNKGVVLGHWLGPNADQVYGKLRKDITADLAVSVTGSYERHGRNYYRMSDSAYVNIGGDPDSSFRDSIDSPSKHFLTDGKIETKLTVGGEIDFALHRLVTHTYWLRFLEAAQVSAGGYWVQSGNVLVHRAAGDVFTRGDRSDMCFTLGLKYHF
jgi:hypothetical protein